MPLSADIYRLLDQALDVPGPDREGWIRSLDSSYSHLIPELRTLLERAAQVDTRDFLKTLPGIASTLEKAGDVVGPYRLLRELGHGGMAAVWLAERTDGLLNRAVALKLPHGEWRRAGLGERMAREREILATLNHPNIARLYDAGLTSDGQPYLALEFVEGVPIDAYCEQHALDVRSRLRLFLQVAQAVAYAHAQLVVHRDLKPSNILVTADGQVRLLDFGIAKLLDDGKATESALTEMSGRVLTLDYAAPEQILGQPITIATDVYSLGVVLYGLLTGTRPYKLARVSRAALEESIVAADPVPASEAAVARALRKQLRGDLDTILLKALKKSPPARYPTVNSLADDLDRYLNDLPVLAQRDSRWYRTGKFIRRNWVAVGASASIAIALLAGAGIALWQAELARTQQHRAEEVKNVLEDVFRNADPSAGGSHDLTAVELLNQAQARIERLPAENAALRLELSDVVATSLINLEQYEKAQSVVERMIAEATRTFGPGRIRTTRARLQLAEIRRMQGRTEGVKEELATLIERLRKDPEALPEDLVFALYNSAHVAIDESRYDDALRAAKEGSAIANSALMGIDPRVIEGATLLSLIYQYNGTPEQAVQAAERTDRLLASTKPGDRLWPDAVDAHFIYGRALADAGKLKEGLAKIGTAVSEATTLYGPDSAMVAFGSADLAKNYALAGDLTLAVEKSARAFELLDQQSEPGSYTHGAALAMKGGVLLEARRSDAALPYLNRAVAELAKALGADNERTLAARTNRALALAQSGRVAEAASELDAIVSMQLPPNRILSYQPHLASGVLKRLQGDYTAALGEHEASLTAVQPGPRYELHRVRVRTEIGLDLAALGRNDEAIALLESVMSEASGLFIVMNPTQSDALVGLGRALLARRAPADARPHLVQADQFWRAFNAENRWAGEAALWLGQCERALGHGAAARLAIERGRRLLEKSSFRSDRDLVQLASEH